MALDAILTVLDTAVAAGSLIEELDRGTDAVVDGLSDVADDLLATYIPAYAAVRSECGNVPKCTDILASIRHKLFREFARLTGIRGIIAGIVHAWRMLPKAMRVVAGKVTMEFVKKARTAMELGSAILEFNPSKAWDYVKAHGSELLSLTSVDYSKEAKDLLVSIYKMGLDVVLGPIENLPVLGPIVSGVVDIASFAATTLSSPIAFAKAIADLIPGDNVVTDAVDDVAWCVSHPLDCAGSVVDTIGDALPWNW
jgi:hypothetical protein